MIFLRRNKRVVFSIILFFTSFLILLWSLYKVINAPLLADNASPVLISLNKATSALQFVHTLKEKKLIYTTKPLLYLIRYQNLAHQLKAGIYQINPGETPMQLLQRVSRGDVKSFNFTIIAGTTERKIEQDLQKAVYLNYSPQLWSHFSINYPNAEGLFLADTYRYIGDADATILMSQANHNLLTYLNESWTNKSPNLPYKTPYELLIAASIIEKESAVPQERKLISGVVVNRLKKNMPLQMDPTVIYALGEQYKGTLSHADLFVESPYNTYKYRGLPPTPIAMVGKEAIDAAAHPQWSNYLYFFAKGDGTHQFSPTYEGQKKAINQYRPKGL